jgi:hypothetical protein
MQVYVAKREYEDFDWSFTIIGVFCTREEARHACELDVFVDGEKRGDGHSVTEYELGKCCY